MITKLLTYIFIFLFTFTSSVNAGYFVKSESGLTVAGSLYSIQDSARKIYSWIEGEGYKGKTTYVDPISGEVYTSDAMLKDGAVDLATAAAISGAFKIGGKVVGKIKNGINKSLDSITFGFDDVLPKETLPALVLKSGQELHTTAHLFNRMLEKNISFKDITDALKNPLGISKVKMDKFGPSYKIVGKKATVIINPETNTLITTYKTTSNAKRLKQILDKL